MTYGMGGPITRISAAKKTMRRQAGKRRQDHVRAIGPSGERTAAEKALYLFSEHIPFEKTDIVSGYWPLAGEFDCRPLMHYFHARGCRVVLPVVIDNAAPLEFRQWHPGLEMQVDKFGVEIPPANCPVLVPTIMLVPLLAFDAAGYRLGYGGGFYDRSLEKLRKHVDVTAVGLAFEMQKLDKLPIDAYDQALNWVVTDVAARKIERKVKT